MKMKLIKYKKYLQRKFSQRYVPQTTANLTSRVSKSYVPFTCNFPMVMHLVPISHKRCGFSCFYLRPNLFKISCKFQNFRCSIHREIPKHPLSEICEKKNNWYIAAKEILCRLYLVEKLVWITLSVFCVPVCLSNSHICYTPFYKSYHRRHICSSNTLVSLRLHAQQ